MRRAGGSEDSVQGIEVSLADGVELVVVTAGAGDGEPKEGLGDDVNLVVHVLDLFVGRIQRLETMFNQTEVTGSNDGFVDAFFGVHSRLFQEVARELLAHELVVGDVGIERADEVVAITPRLNDLWIAFAAAGIGVAHEVHPVTGEVFAVTR